MTDRLNRRSLLTRSLISGAALTAATAASSGLATPALSQNREQWDVLTAFSSTGILGRGIQAFCDKISRRTDGRLTFTIYPAGERVPPFEILDAVGKDTAAMGYGAPYYWAVTDPAFAFIAAMPFGLNALEMDGWLHEDEGLAVANKIYNAQNCHFLPLGNTGNQMGGWFREEVTTIDDLRGKRIRMPGLGGEVLRTFGVDPVLMPAQEIIPAMGAGRLDATEWVGPAADMEMQLYRHAPYYYGPGWHEPATILDLSINQMRWASLASDERSLFAETAREVSAGILTSFYTANARALERLVKEHNVELRRFSEETLMALGQRTGEVLFEIAKQERSVRDVFVSLANFRREVKRYGEVADGAYLTARGLPFVFPN